MAPNSADIFVGAADRITGAVMAAPLATVLPTGVTTAPAAGFIEGGYISDNGLKLAQAQTWVDIRDWNGDIVRAFLSTYGAVLSWDYLETNPASANVFWGAQAVAATPATVTTGTSMVISGDSSEAPRQAWCFNMKDGSRKLRLVVPQGQVTKRGDLVFNKKGALMYSVELTTYPDATGKNFYLYSDDGVFAAA